MRYAVLIFISIIFISCSVNKPGIKPPFFVNPYEFYEKFNLRTVRSSYTPAMRYYCESYPKDFFTAEQVRMPDMDNVVIENKDMRLSFEMVSNDEIILVDEMLDGSYRSSSKYKIYYNEKHDDFRTDRIFIQKSSKCKKHIIKSDQNESN